jgi:hypothetical protein
MLNKEVVREVGGKPGPSVSRWKQSMKSTVTESSGEMKIGTYPSE